MEGSFRSLTLLIWRDHLAPFLISHIGKPCSQHYCEGTERIGTLPLFLHRRHIGIVTDGLFH